MKKLSIALMALMACAPLIADEYTLVWNEDFTDNTLDRAVWNIEVNGDGARNASSSRLPKRIIRVRNALQVASIPRIISIIPLVR